MEKQMFFFKHEQQASGIGAQSWFYLHYYQIILIKLWKISVDVALGF